jgi:bacterioferritin-associated ferredoxin
LIGELRELIQATGAGDGCTACHPRLQELMNGLVVSSSASPLAVA